MQLGAETVLAVLRAAAAHGKMAHRTVPRVEMTVIHQIAGRVDRPRLDLEALPLFTVAPYHRETFALGNANDGSRPVAVKGAAAPGGKFLHMAAVGGPG